MNGRNKYKLARKIYCHKIYKRYIQTRVKYSTYFIVFAYRKNANILYG
jgi:hypothetical protein